MKMQIPSVKGARDFYPEQMRIRTWLYQTMRRVSESFGYEEYDGPFLEYVDLYAAKSGDELVKEQSFVFQDRGGEWITLRPELTPSLARMVAQKQAQLFFPLRWWSFGPMWRYERPQKGRSREFFQWNIDLIGLDSPEADAELVAIAANFLQETGMAAQESVILVNNRRLIDQQLGKLSIPAERRPEILRLIDRRDKLLGDQWEQWGEDDFGLNRTQIDGLLSLLENKQLWQESDELCRFFAAIDALGVRDYVRYAPEIVRGLDYYTGTVFEARDRDGEFRAILGGGRYDNLVGDVGGDALPGVGFAMGDMVIALVLRKYGRLPAPSALTNPAFFVAVFDESSFISSLALSNELRGQGFRIICYNEPTKLVKQLKYADRMGCLAAIILGPDEIKSNSVTVKNLKSRTQLTLPRPKLRTLLNNILDDDIAS